MGERAWLVHVKQRVISPVKIPGPIREKYACPQKARWIALYKALRIF